MKKLGLAILTILLTIGLLYQPAMAAQNPEFEQDLSRYLAEISEVRGFDVTKEEIEASLAYYDENIDNFASTEELSSYLGDVIKSDLSNLTEVYQTYHLDKETLIQLLSGNGEDLSDYVYIDDLNNALSFYQQDGTVAKPDFAQYSDFFNAIGITEDELMQMGKHFESISDTLSSPETQAKLNSLAERIMAFSGSSSYPEVTKDQMDEFISIYNECLSALKIKAVFIIISNGKETPVSLSDLMSMTDTDSLKDIDRIRIEIYNTESQLLADFVISEDLVESGVGGLIEKSAEEVINTVNPTAESEADVLTTGSSRTVKGAKLPKTASLYIPFAVLGLAVTLAGIIMYRKVRKDEIRNTR